MGSRKIAGALVLSVLGVASAAQAATSIGVNGTAALQGSFGMQVSFDGSTNDAYVEDRSPNSETRYVVTWRMNTSPMTMTGASNHQILRAITGDPTPSGVAFQVKVYKTVAAGFEVQVLARLDSGAFTNRIAVVGDASHQYSVDWKASSAPGANDGYAKLYKNGTLRKSLLNLDNDLQRVDMARFGAFGAVDASTSGSFYLDDFISTRTAQF